MNNSINCDSKMTHGFSVSIMTVFLLFLTPGVHAGDHWLSRFNIETPGQPDTILPSGLTVSRSSAGIMQSSSTALFDITIALDSNPQGDDDYKADSGTTDDPQNEYEKRIEEFANAVFQSTNGAHKIKKVTIFRTKPGTARMESADILWDENCPGNKGPRANTSGFGVAGRHIWMCTNWPGAQSLMPTPKGSGYTLAHEWGHYTYGLYDEYAQEQCSLINRLTFTCHETTPRQSDTAAVPAIMNSQWVAVRGQVPSGYTGSAADFLEFSTQNIHPYKSDSKGTNAHKRVFGESAWQTLTRDSATDPKYSWLPKRTWYTTLTAPSQPNWIVNDSESAALNDLDIRWAGNQVMDLSIDVSGSMAGTPLTNAKSGGTLLVDQIQPGTAIGVSSFASNVVRNYAITDIPDPDSGVKTDAKAAITALRTRGSTALYDGLMFSLADVTAFDRNRPGLVYVLSDGADNSSSVTESEVIDAYKVAGVPIIAFAYGSAAPTGTLLNLASQTGGALYQSPTTVADIQAALLTAETRFSSNVLLSSQRVLASGGANISHSIPIDQSLASAQIHLSYTGSPSDFDLHLLLPSGADSGLTFTCQGSVSCQTTLDEAFITTHGYGEYTVLMTNKLGTDKSVTVLVSAQSADTETYDIAVGFSASTVQYPADMIIRATVSKGPAIAGLNVTATITDRLDNAVEISLLDDGKGSDQTVNDGTYSASIPYSANGIYSAVVTASNQAGKAQTTFEGVNFSQQENGSALAPQPTPIPEKFVRVGSASANVAGFSQDDHADNPGVGNCTRVQDDNIDTAGRIDNAGDTDCFIVSPGSTGGGITLRATSLSSGMSPVITVFDSTGTTQIAQADMNNSENPASGVILTISEAKLGSTDIVFVVQHADTSATIGGYAVSVGKSITSDYIPVLIMTPNGGESWKAKNSQTIRWYVATSLTKKSKQLKIQYSKNGGKKWKTLKKVRIASGSFQWSPKPADISSNARLRACLPPVSKKAKPICDGSDGTFEILKK